MEEVTGKWDKGIAAYHKAIEDHIKEYGLDDAHY